MSLTRTQKIVGAAVAALSIGGAVTGLVVTASGPDAGVLQRAISAAPANGTVIIPDGVYASQTVSSSGNGVITVRAQDPGQVQVGGLSVNADKLHFVGIIAAGTGESRGDLGVCGSATAGQCATKFTDLVFDGFRGKSFFIRSSNTHIIRGEFGGFDACKDGNPEDATRFWGGTGANTTPDGDSMVDSQVHDVAAGSNNTCQGTSHAGIHVDCMQNQGGTNMLIQGNTFYNCPTSDIQMAPFGNGNTVGSVTFTKNVFAPTLCCNLVVLGNGSSPAVQTAACSTLNVTGNVAFASKTNWTNLDGCTSENVSGNTLCANTAQAGCAIPLPFPAAPVPPFTTPTTTAATTTSGSTAQSTTTAPTTTVPTTTTAPATTAATTTAPTTTAAPPPPQYSPGCAPTCDEQLAALNQDVADQNAAIAALHSKIDAAIAALNATG